MTTNIVLPVLLATALCLPAMATQATEKVPEIVLSMHPPQDTRLRDGVVIGQGQITFEGEHAGYQVWLDAPKSSSIPGRYVLLGKRNSAHHLRVRLDGESWSGENKDNGGIINATTGERAHFDIVIDGNQHVAADEYAIAANVAAIDPEHHFTQPSG